MALGSSFAAGPGIPTQGPTCGRSDHNYPHLVARALHLQLTDVTCSGATTANILRDAEGDNPAQITAVTHDTALVTVTIGGNDISYSATTIECAQGGPGGSCAAQANQAQLQRSVDALPAALTATIRAIRARAPKATIVIVTYPKVVPTDPASCPRLSLRPPDAALVAGLGEKLERALVTAAAHDHTLLADPYVHSDGHGPCAATASRWLEGASPQGPGFAFHPNANGHVEMAKLVEEALRQG